MVNALMLERDALKASIHRRDEEIVSAMMRQQPRSSVLLSVFRRRALLPGPLRLAK
jgi:hypothetical protein